MYNLIDILNTPFNPAFGPCTMYIMYTYIFYITYCTNFLQIVNIRIFIRKKIDTNRYWCTSETDQMYNIIIYNYRKST